VEVACQEMRGRVIVCAALNAKNQRQKAHRGYSCRRHHQPQLERAARQTAHALLRLKPIANLEVERIRAMTHRVILTRVRNQLELVVMGQTVVLQLKSIVLVFIRETTLCVILTLVCSLNAHVDLMNYTITYHHRPNGI